MSEPVSLRVRTWNIAHGMDVPPMREGYRHERRKHLDEMARLMVQDAPDLVLLQEVPVWAGPLLHQLTGMGVTLAPAYGAHVPFVHVPLPLAVGAAHRAYDRAGAGEAEERFGEYMDLVEEAEDALLELRDRYAATMADDQRPGYRRDFWRQAERLLPSLGARRDYGRRMEAGEDT